MSFDMRPLILFKNRYFQLGEYQMGELKARS